MNPLFQGPTGVNGPKGARGAQGAPVSIIFFHFQSVLHKVPPNQMHITWKMQHCSVETILKPIKNIHCLIGAMTFVVMFLPSKEEMEQEPMIEGGNI